jgi:uncharacterized phage protein gp47/JayE
VNVTSILSEDDTNQLFGTTLTLETPIIGVDDDLLVDFGTDGDGLSGAADIQSDEDLRSELLERIANPVAHFNTSDIVTKAKTVAGVTRVFVSESFPLDGQVTVLFMRDNDTETIPNLAQVETVKLALNEILPANTDFTNDLIVAAPGEEVVNFVFSALSPGSESMQAAVTASLEQFFAEETEVGEDVLEVAFGAAIYNTLDPVTGLTVTSFTTTPAANVVVAAGDIGTLGTVAYNL